MKRGKWNSRHILVFVVFISITVFSILWVYFNLFETINARASSSAQADISFTIEDEIPTPTPTPAPAAAAVAVSGGGGGGGSITKKAVPDFYVDQALIKVVSKVGETFKKSITITNPNNEALKFKAFSSLSKMISFSEEEFEIPAKSEKTVFLTFTASEDAEPDVYTGKVIFETQYTRKEIPTIYEVRSKKALFDVSLNIPAEYKRIGPGEDVFFQVTLLNLEEIGSVDVELEYTIKDFEGNTIKILNEIAAVENQASFSKRISLAEDISFGDYVVAVRAKFGSTVGTASDVFSVVDINEVTLSPLYTRFFLWGIILIIIFLIIIIYELRKRRLKNIVVRQRKELSKIDEKFRDKKFAGGEIESEINKLKTQYSLLEEAYKKGYITKQSYEDGKSKINNLMNKLKKRL